MINKVVQETTEFLYINEKHLKNFQKVVDSVN